MSEKISLDSSGKSYEINREFFIENQERRKFRKSL